MRQTKLLFVLLLAALTNYAQCLTAPLIPMCSGVETLTASSDVINSSQTKYYYGAATTLSNVKLNGGTLVVCGNLTINDLVFDSGSIYIQPFGSLVVTNGAGLVLRGNSAIYNRGTFQCLGNIVLDGTYATAAKPNVIINVLSNAAWKMANQYFVINNPFSKFVNNGIADFHGIITDYNSSAGCVCLGLNSQTRMTVLYNKVKNTYVSPVGSACVYVSQYSQFYDTLTNYPSVNICLGNLHNSDASCTPWGCRPNAWGAAQVTTGCMNCSAVLTFLPVNFSRVEGRSYPDYNELKFELSNEIAGMHYFLYRSINGGQFVKIDSLNAGAQMTYKFIDSSPHNGITSYYISCMRSNGDEQPSRVVELRREAQPGFVYPNPFSNTVNINLSTTSKPAVTVTDITGRTMNNYKMSLKENHLQLSFGQMANGIYFIRVIQEGRENIYKSCKE